MASQYIRYPNNTGGGGGTVTDINGATGPSISILGGTGISVGTAGNNITITNTSPGTGTPNTLAAFNGAGNLAGLTEWVVNATTGEIDGSFTGVSAAPILPLRINSSNTITGNLQGLGIDLNGSSTTQDTVGLHVNFGNANSTTVMNGIQIDMDSATCSGGDINGITINTGTAVSNNPQGVTGLQSGARIQVNGNTDLISAQTFQIGSRLEHAFSVPIGSPVTGTDGLAVNIAGDFIVQDNIAIGPFGLGLSSVGFIASMGIAATKTVDTINVFLPASSFPDPGFTTGGNVTNFHMIRTFAPLPQGGTVNITNLYGLKIDNFGGAFSAAATNTWGVFVEDTALQNHFGGPVDIGSLELNGPTSGRLTINAAAMTTNHTLTMPATQGAASTVLTNNGSGVLSWGSSSGITWATPVNSSITFDTDQTYDLGSPTSQGNALYFAQGTFSQFVVSSAGYFDTLNPNTGSTINVTSPFDMGNNLIHGVTNPVSAQDAATKNYVDSNIGANTSLSNLASVAINTSLLPDTDAAYNLGQDVFNWSSIYVNFIADTTNTFVMDVQARALKDGTGVTALDFSGSTDISVNSHKITNGVDPTSAQDIATKAYVDANIVGNNFAMFNESQTSGTSGGTFTSGAWQTRVLNTTVKSQTWASLSSNQVTLSAGTYLVEASAPAYGVAGVAHKTKLRNTTDSTDTVIGTSEFTVAMQSRSFTDGVFTIAGSKTFELQHQTQTTTVSNGFGIASSYGVSEVYSQIKITKLS